MTDETIKAYEKMLSDIDEQVRDGEVCYGYAYGFLKSTCEQLIGRLKSELSARVRA